METQQRGRALYVVLALVFAGLIVAGATWFYMTGNEEAAAPTDSASTEESTASPSDAQAELDGSIEELDDELAAIEVDEESDDDSVDF